MSDIIASLGPLFLGSRFKRLAERLQAGAARAILDAGLPVQPSHMPLLTALEPGPLTIGRLADAVGFSQPGVTRGVDQLARLGLVANAGGDDQRQRRIALTADGAAMLTKAKQLVWPRVERAVDALCQDLRGSLLDQVGALEAALAERAFADRLPPVGPVRLTIRDYDDGLARAFHDINAEWIESMFQMEQTDREVLENPRSRIIDPGGAILFVEAQDLGVVGTCALQKTGEQAYELTKMGVRAQARGLKAGERLLEATIARAETLGAETLYLLTNSRCEAAIHLYEKLGFQHDAEIMARYGARYARCDVAMRYAPTR